MTELTPARVPLRESDPVLNGHFCVMVAEWRQSVPDEVPHPPADPAWWTRPPCRTSDWRRHVPDVLQRLWPTLSEPARAAAWLVAEHAADQALASREW